MAKQAAPSKRVPDEWQIRLVDPRLIQPSKVRKHLKETVEQDFIKNVTKDLAHPISIRLLGRNEKRLSSFAGHTLSPKYEVFRGGRRWYAHLTKNMLVPAKIIDISDKDALWKAYEENAFRVDLQAPCPVCETLASEFFINHRIGLDEFVCRNCYAAQVELYATNEWKTSPSSGARTSTEISND